MAHIFISYYRGDGDFAELLESHLKQAGFPTWRDRKVRAGDNWRVEIDEALQGADTAVVVMSPAAKASDYVNYEWAFGLGAGLRVIPLLLGLGQKELHPALAALHWLDFSDPLAGPWNELVRALKETPVTRRAAAVGSPRQGATVLEQARHGLDSLIAAERMQAVETLAQMNDPAALEILAGALGHTVREVRVKAACALADLKVPGAVPVLLEAASSAENSWEFVEKLSKIGSPAVPELIQALNHPQVRFREYSVQALGSIRDSAAIPALCDALRDEDEAVRAGAIAALARLGGQAPVQVVLDRLGDDSWAVRAAAVGALRRLGGPEALGGLIRALNDPEETVRKAAAWGLEDARDPEAIAALTERLRKEASKEVRRFAARALYSTKDRAAVPGLLLAIQDEEYEVREPAKQGLGEIGGAEAVSGLVEVIGRPESRGRPEAADVLGTIKDPAAVAALSAALRDPEKGLRAAAASALGSIADPASIPVLIEALRDADEVVRRRAAGALGSIGGASGVPALIEVAVADVKQDVRWAAAWSLKEIGDAAAVPALAEALDDTYDKVRREAIEGLERINTAEARAALRAFRRKQSTSA